MKFRFGKKKKSTDKQEPDVETQCGSRVPLVNPLNSSYSDATATTAATASPFGTPNNKSRSFADMKRKRSFVGLMNRARSFGRKPSTPIDDDQDEWIPPQDVLTPTALVRDDAVEQFRKDHDVSIPVASTFPFDENASMDMVDSWINGMNDSNTTQSSTDADTEAGRGTAESLDDDQDTLSTRGTASVYTYGTTSVFSADTGMESYETASGIDGLRAAAENNSTIHSLAYSQSTGNSTISVKSEYEKQEVARINKDRVTVYYPIKEVPEHDDDTITAGSLVERKRAPCTVADVVADIGVVAGEILMDVKDSVSCMVDTTASTCTEQPERPRKMSV